MLVEDEEMEVENHHEPINLREVANLPINFANFKLIIENAHKFVKSAEGQDLVFCSGSQGSGKSTLLSSLFHGPQKLSQ